MSGILGLYNSLDSAHNRIQLQEMQAAVLHRGKDGHGIWTDGAVGIGHQLFATTPESEFEQSPESDSKGYVISADVRLDNREDLISQLHLDQEVGTLTDPSLILQAYQAWGSDCPGQLLGAFAFIIWDPVKKALFGARDHLGVKPFYYFQQPNYFAAASEIKALLRSPHINTDLDPIRIVDLLLSQLKDPIKTSFLGVQRLPGGHFFERTIEGTLNIHQYWKLDPDEALELPEDEYIHEFQRLFKAAVQCRLRHRVPIGSQLSGGMDSSSITATAEQLLPHAEKPLKTFSATFATVPECDETDYIQAVLAQGQFEPYFVAADQSGPLTHWKKLFQTLDEPALGNGYLSWLMSVEAQKQGVNIILNGYDGDTVIGHGALYPHELAKDGQWKQALIEAKLFAQRFAAAEVTPLYWMRKTAFEVLSELRRQKRWFSILWSIPQIYKPLKLKPLKLLLKFVVRPFYRQVVKHSSNIEREPDRNLTPKQTQQLKYLNPEFLRKFETQLHDHHNQFKPPSIPPSSVRVEQWRTLSSGIIAFPMELLDLVSAVFQIEPRYPLMDKRLVEFCLALPPSQKLHQGWTRYILHQSMEGILPPLVQWRATKSNLSKSFEAGLKQYDQGILDEVLLENPERLEKFINLPRLAEEYSKSSDRNAIIQELWPIITLSLWLEAQILSKRYSSSNN